MESILIGFLSLAPCFLDRINCLAVGQDYFCMEQDCYQLIENNYPMQMEFNCLAGNKEVSILGSFTAAKAGILSK